MLNRRGLQLPGRQHVVQESGQADEAHGPHKGTESSNFQTIRLIPDSKERGKLRIFGFLQFSETLI